MKDQWLKVLVLRLSALPFFISACIFWEILYKIRDLTGSDSLAHKLQPLWRTVCSADEAHTYWYSLYRGAPTPTNMRCSIGLHCVCGGFSWHLYGPVSTGCCSLQAGFACPNKSMEMESLAAGQMHLRRNCRSNALVWIISKVFQTNAIHTNSKALKDATKVPVCVCGVGLYLVCHTSSPICIQGLVVEFIAEGHKLVSTSVVNYKFKHVLQDRCWQDVPWLQLSQQLEGHTSNTASVMCANAVTALKDCAISHLYHHS